MIVSIAITQRKYGLPENDASESERSEKPALQKPIIE